MRHLAAKDGQHLLGETSHLQGHEIVSYKLLVGRLVKAIVALVAGHKRARFASGEELGHRAHALVCSFVVGQGRHVDKVQRGEVIEM